MLAVVPVRDGALPAGGLEAVAECGGAALLAGSGSEAAVGELAGVATSVSCAELGAFGPGSWAAALAPIVDDARILVLPASPDGRDLAPRLAQQLRRPLLAGAIEVTTTAAHLARDGGLTIYTIAIDSPVVTTLQPGVRGVVPDERPAPTSRLVAVDVDVDDTRPDPRLEALLPPDVTTMDLSEATRVVGGGAGLDSADRLAQLQAIATAIDAATGATRVVTDRGWIGHERQIGTTGVIIDPALYLAFGISGAVQHTAGLGNPEHIVSVNVDAHCPMMQMADLAVVADANAVLDQLAVHLGIDG
ncbi:MAG: mycofactocin-associated electron transfer flavoprotein alpha subunit [Acidimicrobiales bacterium]